MRKMPKRVIVPNVITCEHERCADSCLMEEASKTGLYGILLATSHQEQFERTQNWKSTDSAGAMSMCVRVYLHIF